MEFGGVCFAGLGGLEELSRHDVDACWIWGFEREERWVVVARMDRLMGVWPSVARGFGSWLERLMRRGSGSGHTHTMRAFPPPILSVP